MPAILVTSRNAPEDRQRGVDVGARRYIVKGEFDQDELLDRIRGAGRDDRHRSACWSSRTR